MSDLDIDKPHPFPDDRTALDLCVERNKALLAEIERLEAENLHMEAELDRLRDDEVSVVELETRVAELESKINGAVNVGHNDDCMFCGFKDRALTSDVVLDEQKLRLAAAALGGDDE